MKVKTTKIYLCYSPSLFYEFTKCKIKRSNKLKIFNGIYILTNNEKVIVENNLRDIEKHEYFATKILDLATRFKRSKILYTLKNNYSFPFADYYQDSLRSVLSFLDLIFRTYKLRNQKIILHMNSFGDKVIDCYFIRHVKKEYNLKVKFSSLGKIKIGKNIFYHFHKNNFLSILQFLNWTPIIKKSNFINFENKNILFISHPVNKDNEPYLHFLRDRKIREKIILMSYKELALYGLNRIESYLWLTREFFIFLRKLKIKYLIYFLKINLVTDHFQIFANKLYSHNITILLKKTNIKYIFLSFRSFALEKIIFKTCRLCDIKSIQLDFSLGYPIKNNFYKKEIALSNPDILFVGSSFRKFQYLEANKKYLSEGNKMEIIISKCFQYDYAISKNNYLSQNTNYLELSRKQISIFDNLYGENAAVRNSYSKDLIDILFKNNSDFNFIIHSKNKYDFLEKCLKVKNMKYKRALKGDFSLVSQSEIVISIGFQGAAIKSAFAFKKPIIFYSSDYDYFKNFEFIKDESLNRELIEIFQKLIFNNNNLEEVLSNKEKYETQIKDLRKISMKFFTKIGITDKTNSTVNLLKKMI